MIDKNNYAQKFKEDTKELSDSELPEYNPQIFRELRNLANDRNLINFISQVISQINQETNYIKRNKYKKEIYSLSKENKKFSKIFERIDRCTKKKAEKLYKE